MLKFAPTKVDANLNFSFATSQERQHLYGLCSQVDGKGWDQSAPPSQEQNYGSNCDKNAIRPHEILQWRCQLSNDEPE